jgi:hypothetical protein
LRTATDLPERLTPYKLVCAEGDFRHPELLTGGTCPLRCRAGGWLPVPPGKSAMTTYEAVRNLHIFAGTIALASFWTAAWLRKGSGAHLNVGRVFMVAMATIAVTGVPLALAILARGRPGTAALLIYLVVITVTPTWLAWRAIRDKNDFKRYTGPVYKLLAGVNLATGAAMIALGIRFGVVLFTSISLIGLVTGALMLRFLRTPPTERRWWLVRHYGSIIGAGIATHVTFLNLGFSRMLPPELSPTAQPLSWIVPLAVAGIARMYLDRKYGPKQLEYARARAQKPVPELS